MSDMFLRDVLQEVQAERVRQDRKWGEQNHSDGTGPGGWEDLPTSGGIPGASFADLAVWAKARCQYAATQSANTWEHILTEEFLEALAEHDPARLRAELVQVAAVATQWVEAIDRRTTPKACRCDHDLFHGLCLEHGEHHHGGQCECPR